MARNAWRESNEGLRLGIGGKWKVRGKKSAFYLRDCGADNLAGACYKAMIVLGWARVSAHWLTRNKALGRPELKQANNDGFYVPQRLSLPNHAEQRRPKRCQKYHGKCHLVAGPAVPVPRRQLHHQSPRVGAVQPTAFDPPKQSAAVCPPVAAPLHLPLPHAVISSTLTPGCAPPLPMGGFYGARLRQREADRGGYIGTDREGGEAGKYGCTSKELPARGVRGHGGEGGGRRYEQSSNLLAQEPRHDLRGRPW